MLDYGQLYRSNLFRKDLLPHFDENQAVAANDLWQRILGRCGVDIGMPVIDTIVDLGCGEGTLTRELAACARGAATKKGPCQRGQIKFIGIECSTSAISLARRKCRGYPNIRFEQWNGAFPSLFARLENGPHSVEWRRTALVCLSHTWFHLDQADICMAIDKHRPVLLLLDVYQTWDSTIEKLRKSRDRLVLEHGRPHKNNSCIYWLATERQPGRKVLRGIWKMPRLPTTSEHPFGDWLLPPTEQSAITSADLFGKSPDSFGPNVLEESRRQGLITGEHGCDYVTRRVIRHPSGWGEMRCHALVPRDRAGAALNCAYFAAVRNIVTRLFVAPESGVEFEILRSLLDLFNDPSPEWRKRTKFAGSRVAMAILPFDPQTNFARMFGLFSSTVHSAISNHDLILEAPTTDQLRYPTAYGLFHTLENRISSPQAFPLDWAPNYEHAHVDTEFAKLEGELFGTVDAAGSEKEKGRELGYFMLPLYFGSLPLFTLALRFPSLFPTESTDYQVYYATLRNLHAEVKVAFSDDFIQQRLLSPWIAAALAELMRARATRTSGATEDGPQKDVLERLLDTMEVHLFGRVGLPGEDPDAFSVAGVRRLGGALGKEWKSWVLSIPSVPIKKLRSVEAENTRLWKLWRAERDRALLDHELRISQWFEEGGFFCDRRHDHWEDGEEPGNHRYCLNAMLQRLEAGEPGEIIDGLAAQPYFVRSQGHFLLRWLLSHLRRLLSNEPDKFSPDEKDELFQDVKAAFCKKLENTGSGMRFSWRRLGAHITAAANHAVPPEGEQRDGLNEIKVLPLPAISKFSSWHEKMKGPDGRFMARNDLSVVVGELVHALNQLRCVESVELALGEWSGKKGGASLIFNLKAALSRSKGGASCQQVHRHLGTLLKGNASREVAPTSIDRWLYRSRRLVLTISLSVLKGELTVRYDLP